MARVRIQTEPFDVSTELDKLHARHSGVGAICSFVGTVRDCTHGSPVEELELEHYPGMTEKCIEEMIESACERFDIISASVIHRVGTLLPFDVIVLVAVTSAHRHASFQACEYLMDYLKTQAPFWKKEGYAEMSRWVDARLSDDEALSRWGIHLGNASVDSRHQLAT